MSTQNQATDTSQPQILPSFVKGEWWRPEDPQKVADVRNAATGELVARVSTDGIDTAGAVEYARTVGQASLGTLRIHDRALILKQLAQHLGEHKEELYAISYATGATAKDHLIDIDGGIGTLFAGNRLVAAASGTALLAASALTRFGVLEAGLESTKDPKHVIEPQKDRLAARRAAGITDDSITTAG